MLRLAALRLGGGARRRSTSAAVINAAVRAAFAEMFPRPPRVTPSRAAVRSKWKNAKRQGKDAASRPPTPVPSSARVRKTKMARVPATVRVAPAAPAAKAASPSHAPQQPRKTPAPASAATAASKSLVDVVLSGVNCILLKHLLSSSSSSSTSTDIPDVARVLRLDYTTVAKNQQLAHLADILLVNRIHAAVIADVHEHGRAYASAAATNSANEVRAPLVVLVETTLPSEDAEVQQFIVRNALQMHPLPKEVRTAGNVMVRTPPLTVLVLSDEQTARVRTLAELPPPPSRTRGSAAAALPLNAPKPATGAAPETLRATSATPPSATPLAEKKPISAPATTRSAQEQETSSRKKAPSAEPKKPTEPIASSSAPLKETTKAPAAAEAKSAAAAEPAAPSPAPRATTAAAQSTPAPPSVSPAAAAAAPTAASATTTPAAEPLALQSTAATPTGAAPRGFIPIVPPPPIPVEALAVTALASSAAAVAPTEPIKTKSKRAAEPMSKREARRLVSAARRAARVQMRAFGYLSPHRLATPSQARLVAALTAAKDASTPRPPRLLPTGSTKEKLLWTSRPGHPLPLRVIAPLLNPTAYASLSHAEAAAPAPAGLAAEPALHTVVYAVSRESSVATVWLGALQAAADLASALSAGTSRLPAAVAEIAGLTTGVKETPEGDAPADTTVAGTESSSSTATPSTPSNAAAAATTSAAAVVAAPPASYVYILVHTTLSPDDAAVLQQELQYQFTQLRATPAGAELAGLSVLTAQDVSPAQLSYVLEHAVDSNGDTNNTPVRVGQSAATYGARGSRTAAVALPAAAASVSPEAAETQKTFADVYRLMSELPGLRSSSSSSSSPSAAAQHPDALVADAIAVAALTQVLLQRKEAHLRAQLADAQQSNAATADSEAVARAAQRVEMKTMVTEAVEEVSVRHEQATAHLVKTLSSMVGQWSLEKLSDTLEAIIRGEVKPIMDVLEEQRGSALSAVASASPTAAAASPSPGESEDSRDEEADAAAAALQDSVAQVLEQLRELTQRTGTLAEAATTAAATAAASAATVTDFTEKAASGAASASHDGDDDNDHERSAAAAAARARSEEEAEVLRNLHERQKQHETRLSAELKDLKSELQSLFTETRTAATAAASAAAAAATAATAASSAASPSVESSIAAAAPSPSLSPESLEKSVANAMEDVTKTLRHGIQESVIQQLDVYCDVHRSSASNGDGGHDGNHEPSMPVLPVTSFELEEMLSRVVEHTVRRAADEMEGHVRVAVQKAVESELAAVVASPSSSARATTPSVAASRGGFGDADESVKAALESLWARVRAEAAEEEAVKTSQHNRQLLRLFRRQQHLQRSTASTPTTSTASSMNTSGALPLSYVALDEALRTVMHPYMTHMQASITAATAAAASSAPSASSSSQALHAGTESVEESMTDAPPHPK